MLRPLLLAMIAVSSAAGCQATSGLQPVVPVAVKVVHRGKPVNDGQVVLHPVRKQKDGMATQPNGFTNAQGEVKLTTYHTADGAPEGEYIATVIWSPVVAKAGTDDEVREPDRLRGRYADPVKSELRVTISKTTSQPLTLDLK